MDLKVILILITIQLIHYSIKGEVLKSNAVKDDGPASLKNGQVKRWFTDLLETRKNLLRNGMMNKKRSEEVHSDEYYDDDYYHYRGEPMEEPYCPEDMFWHVRGFSCVPYDCPGGNQYRDKHTGECTLQRYGVMQNDWLGRPLRPLR